MLKKTLAISFMALIAHADIISFYKDALHTLEYDKSFALYEHSNKISQKAVTYSKYANFGADMAYSQTYAKLLHTSAGNFGTTDIAISDIIDLFGKFNYKIEALYLDKKTKKAELNVKKEQLFIALSNLVSLYQRTSEKLKLHQNLFNQQKSIYKRLELIAKNGDITALELLRFKNRLAITTTFVCSTSRYSKFTNFKIVL